MSQLPTAKAVNVDYRSHFYIPVTDDNGNILRHDAVKTNETIEELEAVKAEIHRIQTEQLNRLKDRKVALETKLRYFTDLVCGGPAPLGTRNEVTVTGKGTIISSSYTRKEYTVKEAIVSRLTLKRAISEAFDYSGNCSLPVNPEALDDYPNTSNEDDRTKLERDLIKEAEEDRAIQKKLREWSHALRSCTTM